MSLRFFQASVPLSSAAKAQGSVPGWPPGKAAPPLLVLGCPCFTLELVLAVSMTWPPALHLGVQPLFHPQDELGSHSQCSECGACTSHRRRPPQRPGLLLPGAWGWCQNMVSDCSGTSCGGGLIFTGHPCYQREASAHHRPFQPCSRLDRRNGPLLACGPWRC